MRFFATAICLSSFLLSFAASYKSAETDAYINKYKNVAIQQMKQYRIPASITLAQGILESGSGRSDLSVKANNHFGIKCTSDYKGKTYYKKDNKLRDCFRVYSDAAESFRDHSLFLTTRKHYSPLFELKITDYKGWAKGLKKCGYATNPKYPELLIEVIEQNKLYQYDREDFNDDRRENKVDDNDNRNGRNEENKQKDSKPEGVDIRNADNRVEINGVRCVKVKTGETFYSLSKKYGISVSELKTLNDFPDNYTLKVGEYVFLKRKRRNYRALDFHIVQSGETLLSISQYYAIQKNQLVKRNNNISEPLKVGTKLLLH